MYKSLVDLSYFEPVDERVTAYSVGTDRQTHTDRHRQTVTPPAHARRGLITTTSWLGTTVMTAISFIARKLHIVVTQTKEGYCTPVCFLYSNLENTFPFTFKL